MARAKSSIPVIVPDSRNGRQKEKDRSSFYYIYIQQNFAMTNPYCTVRALVGETFPRQEWTGGSAREGAPVLPKGSLGLL